MNLKLMAVSIVTAQTAAHGCFSDADIVTNAEKGEGAKLTRIVSLGRDS